MAGKQLVLVEGPDDMHTLRHFIQRHFGEAYLNTLEIEKRDGVQALLNHLHVDLKSANLERLAIIVDADTDLAARWQSLRDKLLAAGDADIPTSPPVAGAIFTLDQGYRKVKVGVWLMPDNTLPGMLEDFVARLIPPADRLWPRALDCVQQLPDEALPCERTPTWETKSRLHTWLAWQAEPGKPLGQAITKRYLHAESAAAQPFVAWLRQMFHLA